MKAISSLCLFLLMTSAGVLAETNESSNPFQVVDDFAERYQITLRQSTLDKNAIEKPASVQFINARDGAEDSYSVDFGLTGSVIPNTSPNAAKWYAGPTIEYHKQTQTSKKQENFQAGVTAIHIGGDVSEDEWVHFTQFSAKFKQDKSSVGKAFLGKLEYTPLIPDLFLGQIKGPDWLHLVWQPTVGVQFEDGSDIMKSKRSGRETRAKALGEVGLYPFGKALQNHLEFLTSFTYWRTIADSGEFNAVRDNRTLFKTGVTYYVDPKRHFGIGAEYLNGEDVEQGLLKQENIIVSLKIRF